jgi:hypothetical protein
MKMYVVLLLVLGCVFGMLATSIAQEPDATSAAPPAQPAPVGEGAKLRIYQLKSASAEGAYKLLMQLYPQEKASIGADERTNSIMVRATSATLDDIDSIVQNLETAADRPKAGAEPTGSPFAAELPPGTTTTILRLQHAPALSIAEALSRLYANDKVRIVPELVSNSIIVHAPDATLEKIRELVIALEDTAAQNAAKQATPPNLQQLPGGEGPASGGNPTNVDPLATKSLHFEVYQIESIDVDLALHILQTVLPPGVRLAKDSKSGKLIVYATADQHRTIRDVLSQLATSGGALGDAPSELLQGLRSAYERAERQALKTAAQLRRSDPNAPRARGGAHGQLPGDVNAAFEARQNLQRAELAALRERLSRIEQSIADRERLKERIIANRVAELLDPSLQWEPRPSEAIPTPAQTPPSQAASDGPLSPVAPPSPPGSDPARWPPSRMPDASMILRSAEQFRERLRKAQNEVESLSRVVGKEHPSLKDSEWQLRAVQTEYAAQLRLLELELQSAEVATTTTQEEYQRVQELLRLGAHDPLTGGRPDVARRKLEAEAARVRLEQLKTLYDLYKQAKPADSKAKDEARSSDAKPAPELRPDKVP